MFQCPPNSPKDNREKTAKNKQSSTSTLESFPRPESKNNRSTGGWNWPRLVKTADKQGERLPSSTAATISGSAPRSRDNSMTAPVREDAEKKEMPKVKEDATAEDVTAKAELEDGRSVSSRASTASTASTSSSIQTMTQDRETQGSKEASVKGGSDVDKRSVGSSATSIVSIASGIVSKDSEQAGVSKRSLVGGDQEGGESAKKPQSSPDRANAPRRDFESLTDDRNTESNASKVSSRQRVSIAEPLPLPRILVQQPSEASEARDGLSKAAGTPRIIERPLPVEKRDSFEQARARINQEIASEIAKLSPKPTLDRDGQVQPKTLRPRKSAIALRKTRNACVRETFLKALLGREIAVPAKNALRKRARGEQVTIEDVSTLEATEVAVGLIP